jgi:transcriptional regulator with XRE-family HTH domain
MGGLHMYGDILRELRKGKNLLQKDIAHLLGITRQAYGKYELNINEPDFNALVKLSNFYNVSIDYITGRSKIKNIESIYKNYKEYPDKVINLIDNICLLAKLNNDSEKMKLIRIIFCELSKIL